MSAGTAESRPLHIPVMVREVLEALAPREGGTYVDGTFGFGGYARAILEAAACRVFGIDRDPAAVAGAADLVERYGGRLTVMLGRVGVMDRLLREAGIARVDGIALDLGLSSAQLDDASRGFSFRVDGPLDMRMESSGMTDAEVVNTFAEKDLARLIYTYGEERAARRVARAIVGARRLAPITRTAALADIVRRVVGRARDGLDPATRTFLALRIHVNEELDELARSLTAAEVVLNPGGRLVAVSFHSLEDRLVKDFLRSRSNTGAGASRHLLRGSEAAPAPTFLLLRRGVLRPGRAEIAANPRARSARLRWAERTAAPARMDSASGSVAA